MRRKKQGIDEISWDDETVAPAEDFLPDEAV